MNTEFIEHILDVLEPIGNVTARKMFGGYGIYNNKVIIGIVDEDELYFKVDESNLQNYKKLKSSPFTYERGDGQKIAMSYWYVPESVIEDNEKFCEFAESSYKISLKNKLNKKPKNKKPDPNSLKPTNKMYGLGPKSAEWLKEVGIKTEKDLCKIGAVKAYIKLKKNNKKISLNMLWGLHASIEGIHWKHIDKKTKEYLIKQVERLSKK